MTPTMQNSSWTLRPTKLIWLVALAGLTIQLVLLSNVFRVQPSVDDFGAPLTEIFRGNTDGWRALLNTTGQSTRFRPLQSLMIWAAGQMPIADLPFRVHLLGVAWMSVYALTFALWVRLLKLSPWGMIAAAAVFFVHPLMAPPVGSLDGYTSTATAASVWLGTWFLANENIRLSVATLASCIILAFGLGCKEYALAQVPMAVLTLLCFRRHDSWRSRAISLTCVAGMAVAYFPIRLLVGADLTGQSSGGTGLRQANTINVAFGTTEGLSHNPLRWAVNLLGTWVGLLFPGNSVNVYLNQRPTVLLIVGLVVLGTALLLLLGLCIARGDQVASHGSSKGFSKTGWRLPLYLFASVPAATVPVNMLGHPSEMRITAAILPMAVLAGLAGERFAQRRGNWQKIALLFLAAWSVIAARTNWQKIEMLRQMGDRASAGLASINDLLPSDLDGKRVALVYLNPETDRRYYSVFAGDYHQAIGFPFAWLRYGQRVETTKLLVDSAGDVNLNDHDYVLLWQKSRRRFELLKPSQTSDDLASKTRL